MIGLAPRPPGSLQQPAQNQLIAAATVGATAPLPAAFELVPMVLGQLLYEPGSPMQHAWFPTTAVASLHYVTESGASAETAGVGREGMVGIALFMGGQTTVGSAVVQSTGHGYRVHRHALMQAFDGAGPWRGLLLRYTQALMTQISQTAACYRHHSVEQQLARWLLATVDRSPAGELVITQELVAGMLGVRRESITQAAGALQDMGYIRYRRGHISVLDPAGLRGCACECYGIVKREFARLMDR